MNKLEKYKMGKEYKPKYKLTIKYPRLPLKFESGDVVYYNVWSKAYVREKFPHYAVDVNEVENNPDFWELIEDKKPKPLFITEDGVDVFNQEEVYYVTDKLEKINSFINWFTIESIAKDTKIFKHESNADEYIWRNKRVFSYEDMMKAKHSNILTYEDIEKAAIERCICFKKKEKMIA